MKSTQLRLQYEQTPTIRAQNVGSQRLLLGYSTSCVFQSNWHMMLFKLIFLKITKFKFAILMQSQAHHLNVLLKQFTPRTNNNLRQDK